MKKRRPVYIAVLAIITSIAGIVVWRSVEGSSKSTPPATAAVARRNLRASVTATGTIKAQVGAAVKVGARISGRVEQLAVQVGDRVTPGQVIAVLQHDDLQAAVDKARADLAGAESRAAQVATDLRTLQQTVRETIARQEVQLSSGQARLRLIVGGARREEVAQAEAAVRQAEANADLAAANKERVQQLFDDGAVARRDLDAAVRDLSVAAAQLRTAQEQLRLVQQRYRTEEIQIARDDLRQAELALALARADLGRVASKERELAAARQSVRAAVAALKVAQTNLGYATITVPIGGVVASVSTQQGETVTVGAASGAAPTFVTIVDLRRLETHALVDETDIGKVRTGQAVTFTVATFPDREFTGKVTAIYPTALVEQNVVTYDVVIAIHDSDAVLRPDMTATATIVVAERTQVLAVPNQAVRRVDGQRVVYVQQGEQFAPRVVKIGWRDKTYTEILSGLREGERVLIGEPTTAVVSAPDASPGAK